MDFAVEGVMICDSWCCNPRYERDMNLILNKKILK